MGWASQVGQASTWDDLSGRIVLEYEPIEDALFYASVGRGFRSGNWNGVAFGRVQQIENPVDPEVLTAYEVGAKTELFDNRLRANFAAFYSDYDDLQVSIFVDAASVLANAAGAEIYGAEVEFTAALAEGLTGRLAIGYLEGEYVDFCDGNSVSIDPSIPFDTECGNDLSGNRLVNAPEWTLTASADYVRPISQNWEWSIGGDVRYQTEVFFTAFNFEHLGEDAFALWNFRTEFSNAETGLSFGAWIKNAFDESYRVDGNQIRAPFGHDLITYGQPQFYGVTVSKTF
ncbi:TonB-dependent receptor [Henriciella mobilis]|uniref:TonB-dependent receptor n=1 Tax=Henriciella mobilis TaxID=2305467 RepID=UPI000E66F285|nr:TonB-dependent receptor [Henriciella mobilis]RIJ16593.1 TonB-dependent receptor [Henriciella mobilis]